MRGATSVWLLLAMLLAAVGCDRQQVTAPGKSPQPSPDRSFLASVEPPNPRGIVEVRKTVKDGESVVVVGRVGGSQNPWVEGRAAFSLVDLALLACSDKEGDHCETPWDYCCETDRLPNSTLLVKLVDDSGQLVQQDTRTLLGIQELQTLVVKGTAQRDDVGNVTLFAHEVSVRR